MPFQGLPQATHSKRRHLTAQSLVQVCDFNLSRVVEETVGAMTSLSATNPKWLAPEILSGRPCTTASDVYAFGIIL